MPQPHPGQEWKHGWIPLTAAAVRSKNHGRSPGAGSLLSRMTAEAAETHNRMKAKDAERSRTPGTPAASPSKKPTPKTRSTPKAGAKVGADATGKPVRVGDEVRLTAGEGERKNAHVIGKGRAGRIRVRTEGGQEIDAFQENIRNRADYETSRQADAAIRRAAGRPAGTPSISEIQNRARDAYQQLADEPGDWVKFSRLREKMGNDLPRADVDRALLQMGSKNPNVFFAPEADQKTLTAAERAAALNVVGVPKHMIAISAR